MAYPCGQTRGHKCTGPDPISGKYCKAAKDSDSVWHKTNTYAEKKIFGVSIAGQSGHSVKAMWKRYGKGSLEDFKVLLAFYRNEYTQSLSERRSETQERIWTEEFVPQNHGGSGGNKSNSEGKTRSNPVSVLYTAHMYTGYVSTSQGDVLAVVMKTGKTDHFEDERRKQFRTSGLLMNNFQTTKVSKEKQAKAEVEKRNALRLALRKDNKVLHFLENDAIVIENIAQASEVISNYFSVAAQVTKAIL